MYFYVPWGLEVVVVHKEPESPKERDEWIAKGEGCQR
jgi:hypothetical protein